MVISRGKRNGGREYDFAQTPKGEVECTREYRNESQKVAKRVNFVSPNEKAKSAVVAQLVRIARKARLGYDDFLYISQQARKKLGLRRGQRAPAAEAARLFADILA